MANQIDQSVKIEETRRSTTLGLSNEKEYAILIPAKVKRKLQELFRKRGRSRIFIYKTFAAGVVLLLQNCLPKHQQQTIIVDQEYPGKERMIRSMIYGMLARTCDKMPEITFKRIGKKSKAHEIAHHTTTKERKPDKIVKFSEIRKLIAL